MSQSKHLPSNGKPVTAAKFPLTKHPNGCYCKKSAGVQYYFGRVVDGPDAALAKWRSEWDHIVTFGCRPTPAAPLVEAPPEPPQLTIKQLANVFLNEKQSLVETGELSPRSWAAYRETCTRLVELLGKDCVVESLTPADFGRLRASLARKRGVVALGNEIQRCRTVFKLAADQELIARPVRYGTSFKKPSKSQRRLARGRQQQEHGSRMLEAAEIRQLLAIASPAMRSMILLSLNAAFGAADLAALRVDDVKGEWVRFDRIKTGVSRSAWLWPETRQALKVWRPLCPQPKDAADKHCMFLTTFGTRWLKIAPLREEKQADGTVKIRGGTSTDAIGQEFNKLLRKCGLKRHGVGLYALRRSFATIASGTLDRLAVGHVMGHIADDMTSVYVQEISDDRIRRVCEAVRTWLYPPGWEEADKLAEQERQQANA